MYMRDFSIMARSSGLSSAHWQDTAQGGRVRALRSFSSAHWWAGGKNQSAGPKPKRGIEARARSAGGRRSRP
jgi:hypothetical protein